MSLFSKHLQYRVSKTFKTHKSRAVSRDVGLGCLHIDHKIPCTVKCDVDDVDPYSRIRKNTGTQTKTIS